MKENTFRTAEFINKKINKEKLAFVIIETGEKNKYIPNEHKFIVKKELLSKAPGLFKCCLPLKRLDLTKLDFSEITTMEDWFSITNIEFIRFPEEADCRKLTTMSNCFFNTNLTFLNLSFMKFNLNSIVKIQGICSSSRKLRFVVMPELTTEHLDRLFMNCESLEEVIAPITVKSNRKLPMHQCFCNNIKLENVDFTKGNLNFNFIEMMKIHKENIKSVPENCKFHIK